MDSLQELTNAVNSDKEPAEIHRMQQIYSGRRWWSKSSPVANHSRMSKTVDVFVQTRSGEDGPPITS